MGFYIYAVLQIQSLPVDSRAAAEGIQRACSGKIVSP